MKWGGFMERGQGAKKGGGWRLAGKMLRRGKGEGCGFEGERFLKMWNRMYIYIQHNSTEGGTGIHQHRSTERLGGGQH